MFEPLKVSLPQLEYMIKAEMPQITEEQLKQELYKAPYTQIEVDEYMASKARKEDEFYKLWLQKTTQKKK